MTLNEFLVLVEKTEKDLGRKVTYNAKGTCFCSVDCPCDFFIDDTGNWTICGNADYNISFVSGGAIDGKEVV